ncbi:MAG: ATP-binding cassette domain-containing protein, partial [Pseudomonadota bacterium]
PDDRIGLLGANGNGKSTLAKLLSGRLKIQSGRMKAHHNMQIAYFAQHQLDELRPNESAYDHVRAMMENGSDNVTEAQARARTAQIGLDASKMDTPAKNLSGGERARLLLGLATFNGAHLIILDEPTNHLDIDSREALVHALNEYEGAVIMISHDRHLIEASADRLWLVADGTVQPYEGDLDEYRTYILQTKKAQQKTGAEKKSDADPANSSASAAERRREAAEKRAEIAPLRAEIKTLEKTISVLQKKIALADEKMAIPNLFTDHPEKAAELGKIRARLARELEDAENAWLEKSEALEEAGA